MLNNKIAIQGIEGSFHQEATWQFYGSDIGVYPCSTFSKLVDAVANNNSVIGGVMAIENSIAGSILPNYNLLQNADLHIVGEVYLQIKQQLLIYPGSGEEHIREVHSHPMALLQCIDFLETKHWKLIETEDTALSAKQLAANKKNSVAVIASAIAADLYELEFLANDIHSNANNYTRFLVLEKKKQGITDNVNKASVHFAVNHQRGSLANLLSGIADEGINLSKLQSFPIPGSDFKYRFHADLEFDDLAQIDKGFELIKSKTTDFKVFGVYKKGIFR